MQTQPRPIPDKKFIRYKYSVPRHRVQALQGRQLVETRMVEASLHDSRSRRNHPGSDLQVQPGPYQSGHTVLRHQSRMGGGQPKNGHHVYGRLVRCDKVKLEYL